MKKILSMIAVLAISAGLLPTCYAVGENDLIAKVKTITTSDIVQTFYDDFDGDGTSEMFALAGELIESDGYYPLMFCGEIIYASDSRTEIVDDKEKDGGLGIILDGYGKPNVITQSRKKLLVYNNVWSSGEMKSTVLSVENEIPRSFKVDGILEDSLKGLLVEDSAYDLIIEKTELRKGNYYGMGRTYKSYWHYWDSDKGELKEYGAIPITEQQFLQFKGADEIVNAITDRNIYNILYRGNGIININTYKETSMLRDNDAYEFKNIIVWYDGDTVTAGNQIYYNDGLYLPELDPKIAVYPEFKSPQIKVVLNGKGIEFDQPPIMAEGDRVMVPIRAIFEALGYTLSWDQATQTATAVKEGSELVVKEGLSGVHLNGEWIPFDVPNMNVSERILVPVRIISECAGANVKWDGTNKTVILTY